MTTEYASVDVGPMVKVIAQVLREPSAFAEATASRIMARLLVSGWRPSDDKAHDGERAVSGLSGVAPQAGRSGDSNPVDPTNPGRTSPSYSEPSPDPLKAQVLDLIDAIADLGIDTVGQQYPPSGRYVDEAVRVGVLAARLRAACTDDDTSVAPTEQDDERWCCSGDWRGSAWRHDEGCEYSYSPERVRLVEPVHDVRDDTTNTILEDCWWEGCKAIQSVVVGPYTDGVTPKFCTKHGGWHITRTAVSSAVPAPALDTFFRYRDALERIANGRYTGATWIAQQALQPTHTESVGGDE